MPKLISTSIQATDISFDPNYLMPETSHTDHSKEIDLNQPGHAAICTKTLPIRDAGTNEVHDCRYDSMSGKLEAPPESGGPYYLDLGHGSEIIVASSYSDALAIHQYSIGARTVAPLLTEDLIAVCARLIDPSYKYLILGSRDHTPLISAAKRQLNCKSAYPPLKYKSWEEFIAQDGIAAVTGYLTNSSRAENAIDSFVVKDKHVENIESESFIFDNLIINQHIVVLTAEPNAGKTTIMNWICSQISETCNVVYINSDCSGADLKRYQEYAENYGFRLVNFDITDTEDAKFFEALDACDNLENQVFVVDTLKKCVDLMGKSSVKNFMKMLRKLCVKGATFVLLAHTNKHKSKDGLPIFEGVGDVRSDCDELIYLIPQDQADGSKIVTTALDKTRGIFEPITFTISTDRAVSLIDYVDLVSENQHKADQPVISAINLALTAGMTIQQDIVDSCQSNGIGKRTATKALEHYSKGPTILWSRQKGDHNAWLYTPASK